MAKQTRSTALDKDLHPVAIVLDPVHPARTARRLVDKGGNEWSNEGEPGHGSNGMHTTRGSNLVEDSENASQIGRGGSRLETRGVRGGPAYTAKPMGPSGSHWPISKLVSRSSVPQNGKPPRGGWLRSGFEGDPAGGVRPDCKVNSAVLS